MHVRHPTLLTAAPIRAGAWTFSALYLLESAARGALITVLPLTAYALFHDKGTVSLIYTAASLAALVVSFAIPFIVRRLTRRWTYSLGCLLLGLYALLLALDAPVALVAAMFCRTMAGAILNIALNLYIMDYIGKRDLTRSEPLRFGVSTFAWSVTPYLGVRLLEEYGLWAPVAISLAATLLLAGVFWYLRLVEGGPFRAAVGTLQAPLQNPVASIWRFIRQPRLRLAWAIAFARSSFWVTLFIYIPILMVEGGLGAAAGGIAVGAANLMLFNNFFARGWAVRHSLRRVLGAAFMTAAGLVLVAAALSHGKPAWAGAVMVAAAFFVSITDGLGPVPFLRAVRARERAQMTTVYRTYLDFSELLPPLAYFFLFQLGGFPAAFAGIAALLAGMGLVTLRHVPRGM